MSLFGIKKYFSKTTSLKIVGETIGEKESVPQNQLGLIKDEEVRYKQGFGGQCVTTGSPVGGKTNL